MLSTLCLVRNQTELFYQCEYIFHLRALSKCLSNFFFSKICNPINYDVPRRPPLVFQSLENILSAQYVKIFKTSFKFSYQPGRDWSSPYLPQYVSYNEDGGEGRDEVLAFARRKLVHELEQCVESAKKL